MRVLLERIADPDRTIPPREFETAFRIVERESTGGVYGVRRASAERRGCPSNGLTLPTPLAQY